MSIASSVKLTIALFAPLCAGPVWAEATSRDMLSFMIGSHLYLGYSIPADDAGNNFVQCGYGPIRVQLPDEPRRRQDLSDCPGSASVFARMSLPEFETAALFSADGTRISEVFAFVAEGGRVATIVFPPELDENYEVVYRVARYSENILWVAESGGSNRLLIQETVDGGDKEAETLSREQFIERFGGTEIRTLVNEGWSAYTDNFDERSIIIDHFPGQMPQATIDALRYPSQIQRF